MLTAIQAIKLRIDCIDQLLLRDPEAPTKPVSGVKLWFEEGFYERLRAERRVWDDFLLQNEAFF